jgi:hypothetical protein
MWMFSIKRNANTQAAARRIYSYHLALTACTCSNSTQLPHSHGISLSHVILTTTTFHPPAKPPTHDGRRARSAHDHTAPLLLRARPRLHWSQNRHNTTVWTDSRQGSGYKPHYCLCQRLHWNRSDWNVISQQRPTVWHQHSLFRADSLARYLLQFAWDWVSL